MEKIGLGSRLVAKFSQLVAFVLIAAVLGGSRCVELCSFLAFERQTTAAQSPEPEMPCHQKHSPRDSQPAGDQQCSHREMVAEKRSNDSSAKELQSVSFVAVRIDAQIVPQLSASPLTIVNEHFPGFSSLTLTSILRI